ncbi:MAG: undecaprenyldiphospho-muramoylpentapeptide beta-N-acetylglucosaminyltransferase [Candidatus Taylorbacteria bacterium RIFCSPHIGHO2_02_FULL_44_36]|uniref:UDP-N-acetylglucosamine--N-acetylmuramyl-(pentapeptide) pyrophosphoryl-undecaprenol N-acetylglucosamine transferase n=1 Tax=Candidatus Taylorbacteria bacterium RIFCSPLOWO2_12_FULL_44_15c TaxID=1802333 RepID=A0A1G2P505_9BACT|nr:MAG: undecaprenyldiphospho-muramoylpentapeptide beta-N-acetylglucosaminyltransferase [Candidatus Taylorbacteria bacterium RIFCSPHIGHO2_02_FULL_44_36]OHA38034.1 MAG: undecaprenyldiphospho-muramoylpentapeptide beta-N-acetylglucosaminyltransferase [Candidatus Taylorbacteria bacterium RIFCSPLOWO2_02_FULL_44_35]OHA43418.1 MAG: undecaprenyldiphospho-muramoylpentapeptide beta-N-acetylglucosaminyltransferase [Candidatus Taylorbacteria bacterium RIFCSPLOWO2_12_FULL_44_15c]
MKILLTGGGSGGHFYPIIAVAEAIHKLVRVEKLIAPELYFMSDLPRDEKLLYDNEIIFKKISAGKIRRYFSLMNFTDLFKTFFGTLKAVVVVYSIYPDVVFGKGGYASFPALLAARIFGIPVVIHESDSVPGKVNLWAGKFAAKVAVSYPEAARYFPADKVACVGNPIRESIKSPATEDARAYFDFVSDLPVILIIGGSQGAELINDTVLGALPSLLQKYQIIHQTGKKQFALAKEMVSVALGEGGSLLARYKVYEYLDDLPLKMAAGAADVVVSRAGSALFEFAAWGKPAIVIPITESNGNHQRENAYNFARKTGATVIEENNLSPNLFESEISRLLADPAKREALGKRAKEFAATDAADKIARELINIAITHEV